MEIELFKSYINQATQDMFDRGKISADVQTELEDYTAKLTASQYINLKYFDFDQDLSDGVVFNLLDRQVEYTSGTANLQTSLIDLAEIKIKQIIVNSLTPITSLQISYDGTDWFNLSSLTNICENITDGFYINIPFTSGANEIYNIIVCYDY